MNKRLYVFFKKIFIIVFMFLLILTNNVFSFQKAAGITDYYIKYGKDRKTLEKYMQDLADEYYYSNDNDQINYVTMKVAVTKKSDEDGNIGYFIGKGDELLEWTEMSAANVLFDSDGEREMNSSWDLWMDVFYSPTRKSK